MKHTSLTTLLAAALAVGVVTGCDGQSTSSSDPTTRATTAPAATSPSGTAPAADPATATATAAPVKACQLLTKKDAEALATTPLLDGVEGPASCMYPGPTSGPTPQVEIYVGDGAKKYYDIDRTLKHTFTPFTGAGDEGNAEDGTVFFRKGATWVAIRLVRLDDPALHAKPLQDLAHEVAARM